MKIINCWSTTSSRPRSVTKAGDIVVIYRNNKGRHIKIIKDQPWYFFVQDTEPIRKVIRRLHLDIDACKGDNPVLKEVKAENGWVKLTCDKRHYRDRRVMELIRHFKSNGIQTYEADVGPAKRYIIGEGHTIDDFENVNLMYFDIETDDSSGKIEYVTSERGKTSINAKTRILSFCAVDQKGKEYFIYDEDEKILLEKINEFLSEKEVDMLVGWNSKDFDIPYIVKRMEVNDVNSTYVRNILHEDMMKRVQYFYSKDPEARQTITSYGLNSISKFFLNEEKLEREGRIIDLYKQDFETFKAYNIQDCQLLRKLEDKLGLIELTYMMFQMCGCTAQDWSMVKAIDNFLLIEANKNDIHYPTNENYIEYDESPREEYLGAFVLNPTPGLYNEVYDLDFKSLYPNIIRTFNISPDTVTDKSKNVISTPGIVIDGVTRGKYSYTKDQGVIPRKIKLLLDERAKIRSKQKNLDKRTREWKDLNVKQLVVKELANSIYGVIGNQYFRCFNIDMAESITATGQYLIKYIKRTFEEKGRKVIYGDTDSAFVILNEGEDVKDVLKEFNKEIAEHLSKEFGVVDCTIELDLDKVFKKFLITSKKKYAGLSEGITKITGLECIKRDTVNFASRWQKEIIDELFKSMPKEGAIDNVEATRKIVMESEMDPNDILIHKKIGKDAKLYGAKPGSEKKYTPPIQVRIVKDMEQRKKLKGDKTDLSKGGSIISFIYTNSSTDGVHISEFKGKWDREHYWNKIIYPPVLRILEVTYPDHDWYQYFINYKPPRKRNAKDTEEIDSEDGVESILQDLF